MTEYKCGNCREVFVLSPKARFCPECGSSSLNLVIKELTEPAQKETLGIYSPPASIAELEGNEAVKDTLAIDINEEEDRPRRPRRRSK
jgi:hypothetical protein